MVKLFCDSGSLADIEKYADDPRISGFTTNPSILKKAGITNYREFAKKVLSLVKGKPVSFEVLSDDWEEMERQAKEIQSWGDNVWVKIPVTNTKGKSSANFISHLDDVQINVTAIMTADQLHEMLTVTGPQDILSIFVGRMRDAGAQIDGLTHSKNYNARSKVLWASARQVFDVYEAEQKNFDIITLTPNLIEKLYLRGKDLHEYSIETVKQFHEDGKGIHL